MTALAAKVGDLNWFSRYVKNGETLQKWNNDSSGRSCEPLHFQIGDDGNVYLMRRLSPAIMYAISPAGEVVRRFTVDPGNADYMPDAVHIASGRIALLFWESQARKALIKVVDFEGRELATYEESAKDGTGSLGGAFACYSQNPERFTFLFADDNGYLGFHIAEPR